MHTLSIQHNYYCIVVAGCLLLIISITKNIDLIELVQHIYVELHDGLRVPLILLHFSGSNLVMSVLGSSGGLLWSCDVIMCVL